MIFHWMHGNRCCKRCTLRVLQWGISKIQYPALDGAFGFRRLFVIELWETCCSCSASPAEHPEGTACGDHEVHREPDGRGHRTPTIQPFSGSSLLRQRLGGAQESDWIKKCTEPPSFIFVTHLYRYGMDQCIRLETTDGCSRRLPEGGTGGIGSCKSQPLVVAVGPKQRRQGVVDQPRSCHWRWLLLLGHWVNTYHQTWATENSRFRGCSTIVGQKWWWN